MQRAIIDVVAQRIAAAFIESGHAGVLTQFFPRHSRVLLPNLSLLRSRQSHRLHHYEPGSAESLAGSDHASGLSSIRDPLHASADQAKLSLGGSLPGRLGLFHVSFIQNI